MPRKTLLWFNRYCLLDSTSGASIDIRQQLAELCRRGWQVIVGGATIFDSAAGHEAVMAGLEIDRSSPRLNVTDATGVTHHLIQTRQWQADAMTNAESNQLGGLLIQLLEQYQPEVFYYYGGNIFDLWMATEARRHGCLVTTYIANQNYATSTFWYRDVDLALTNTAACAQWYREQIGIPLVPLGLFVDPARVVAEAPCRQRVLFINPTPEKGALLVAQLARYLERRRPDIQFEVVQSRGDWQPWVDAVLSQAGEVPRALDNVIVTPTQADMRAAYGRARLLLAPSLWWETGGRVAVEAGLNGIPCLVTDRGGLPEMMGPGGIKVELPPGLYEPPYHGILEESAIAALAQVLIRFVDDEAYYQHWCTQALAHAQAQHSLAHCTDRLEQALLGALEGAVTCRATSRS